MTELPDFLIPHQEKIDWMVETHGWALEAVPAAPSAEPPVPGYAYSVGVPEGFQFPEIAVFGLTPVAANGLIGLVVDCLRGGTEIPLGVDVVGLLDGEQRCRFAPIAAESAVLWMPVCRAWRRGGVFTACQLLWPDRNGFLPHEAGFQHSLLLAQPVIGTI